MLEGDEVIPEEGGEQLDESKIGIGLQSSDERLQEQSDNEETKSNSPAKKERRVIGTPNNRHQTTKQGGSEKKQ
jgi:hypothetical protein